MEILGAIAVIIVLLGAVNVVYPENVDSNTGTIVKEKTETANR